MGGEFGVVLFGWIQNDGKHGIEVYRNSNIKRNKPYWDVQWNSKNLVPPSEDPIPIVIKITTKAAELDHTMSWDDKPSLLEKEIRRTKEASKFTFYTGHRILPDIYDIKIKETRQVHPIHKEGYIQHQIQGKTVTKIITDFTEEARHSMVNRLTEMFSTFDQLLDKAKNRPVDEVVEMTADQELFNKAVDKAIKEMWLRARLEVTNISFLMNSALLMWKRMFHCDSLGTNIMMIRHIIKTEEELKRGKEDGITIISSHNVEYAETTKTSDIEKQDLKRGIRAYSCLPGRIKWVDAGRALPILPILREIRKEKPEEPDPAKFLIGGCEIYREVNRPDFVELQRGGVHQAFGWKHRELYKKAMNHMTRRFTDIWSAKHSKVWEAYRAGNLDSTEFASHQGAAMTEIWKGFFSAKEKYEKEVAKIDGIFSTILGQIGKLPQTLACHKSDKDAVINFEKVIRIRMRHRKWSLASEVIDGGCSLADMRKGVKEVQRLIKEAAGKFPDFATPKTYGTSDT